MSKVAARELLGQHLSGPWGHRAVAVRVVETGEVRLADSISRARAAPVHEAVILQLLGDVVKHAETVQSQVYADTQWLRDAGSPEDVSLGYALSMDKMLDAAENLDRATLLAVSAQQAADAKAEAEAAFAHASSVTEAVEAQTATHREARAAAGARPTPTPRRSWPWPSVWALVGRASGSSPSQRRARRRVSPWGTRRARWSRRTSAAAR
jgi:hypothetical protein